jgi:hypothetical protein
LLLKPLFGLLIGEQQTIANTNASITLYILLGAHIVLISHVHNSSCFASVRFLTENTLEVFLNIGGDTPNSSLLTWTVLAITRSFTFHEIRN